MKIIVCFVLNHCSVEHSTWRKAMNDLINEFPYKIFF